MAKNQNDTKSAAAQALSDAVTRAIHWAPESLLRNFETGERDVACRRLALRVVVQLGGDGWAGSDADALDDAVAAGISRAGEGFLVSLGEARRCNGRLLDALGEHIGERVSAAMKEGRVRLVRRWAAPSVNPAADCPLAMRGKSPQQ